MNTKNTKRKNGFGIAFELGRKVAEICRGIIPCTVSETEDVELRHKGQWLTMRERLFYHHRNRNPLSAARPAVSTEEFNVWEVAAAFEAIIVATDGPTLEWSDSFQTKFENDKVLAGISDEWAFEVLLQRAVSYVKPDFSEEAIRSLKAAMHTASDPSSRGCWEAAKEE